MISNRRTSVLLEASNRPKRVLLEVSNRPKRVLLENLLLPENSAGEQPLSQGQCLGKTCTQRKTRTHTRLRITFCYEFLCVSFLHLFLSLFWLFRDSLKVIEAKTTLLSNAHLGARCSLRAVFVGETAFFKEGVVPCEELKGNLNMRQS